VPKKNPPALRLVDFSFMLGFGATREAVDFPHHHRVNELFTRPYRHQRTAGRFGGRG
jgi:hypothetical protein